MTMNGRVLLRQLRSLTGIRYSMHSSCNDKGWSAYLQIITKNKYNYSYDTGDIRFIKKTGAEYYVAKNAAVDICRIYNIRDVLQNDIFNIDTAASKMDKYIIDFSKPIRPINTDSTVPVWYSNPVITTVSDSQTVEISPEEYTKVVLIDLENVPLLSCRQYHSDTLYIGFLTVHHNSAYKYKDWDAYHESEFQMPDSNNKCIYYTKGRYKEMVDHFMTFMSRSIVDYVHNHLTKCTSIYIVSKDNSALCTKECIKIMLKDKSTDNTTNIKVKLATSIQETYEYSQ